MSTLYQPCWAMSTGAPLQLCDWPLWLHHLGSYRHRATSRVSSAEARQLSGRRTQAMDRALSPPPQCTPPQGWTFSLHGRSERHMPRITSARGKGGEEGEKDEPVMKESVLELDCMKYHVYMQHIASNACLYAKSSNEQFEWSKKERDIGFASTIHSACYHYSQQRTSTWTFTTSFHSDNTHTLITFLYCFLQHTGSPLLRGGCALGPASDDQSVVHGGHHDAADGQSLAAAPWSHHDVVEARWLT